MPPRTKNGRTYPNRLIIPTQALGAFNSMLILSGVMSAAVTPYWISCSVRVVPSSLTAVPWLPSLNVRVRLLPSSIIFKIEPFLIPAATWLMDNTVWSGLLETKEYTSNTAMAARIRNGTYENRLCVFTVYFTPFIFLILSPQPLPRFFEKIFYSHFKHLIVRLELYLIQRV